MSVMPMPGPPATRFVPAVAEVNERRGITVVVDRQPNLCRWAIHTGQDHPAIISGPERGQPQNPSNRELAAQISGAIARTGATGPVFAGDWATTELLREKSSLPVSDLCAPQTAITAARKAIADVEKKLVTGLILATDASRGKGKDVNGCGWVLAYADGADPMVGGFTTTSSGGIRAGELAAIRRGLQATLNVHPVLREGAGSLTVLTDSKAALDTLEKVRQEGQACADHPDCVLEARRILGSARGVNIRFEWVRGHNGHALNELADRLAVLARRNREMGVDEVTNARMMAAVRADAKDICTGIRGGNRL